MNIFRLFKKKTPPPSVVENHDPLNETPCLLLMLNLRTGEKQTKQISGKNYIKYIDEENHDIAWGVYRIIYSASTHLNKISRLTLLVDNVLWERHYIDRFGYVDSGE